MNLNCICICVSKKKRFHTFFKMMYIFILNDFFNSTTNSILYRNLGIEYL